MRKHEANKRSNSSSNNNNNNDKTTYASPLSAKKNKTVVTTTTAAPLADFTLAPSGWDARKFQSCEGLGEKALTVPPLLTQEGINAFEVPHTYFLKFIFVTPKNNYFSLPLSMYLFDQRVLSHFFIFKFVE